MMLPDALGGEPVNHDQWRVRAAGMPQNSVWGALDVAAASYNPVKASQTSPSSFRVPPAFLFLACFFLFQTPASFASTLLPRLFVSLFSFLSSFSSLFFF